MKKHCVILALSSLEVSDVCYSMINLLLALFLSGVKTVTTVNAAFIDEKETCTDMVFVRAHPDVVLLP